MKVYLRILLLTCLVIGTLTQDFGFDLSDALDEEAKPTPPKPAEKPKDTGDGLDLLDAFGPDPVTDKPPVKPPYSGGGGGHFGDSDLDFNKNDGRKPGGGGGFSDTDLVDNFDPDGGKSGGGRDYDTRGGADQPEDLDLPWGQIQKMLNANMPEEFYMWLSNMRQVLAPLLQRALDLLQAIP
ncbi:CD99 molecule isoform X2 [Gouania willdenowi]|uniref:CD99 molecule isoform X2 n=1 Tax=Gouania willdenowi TaxID=441366 RepID=UPI001055AE3B|nr:uncharacterized protein LOC114476585 isoform X2 [Gouania willdenowi]